jgi:transcriptional regulator with XRE-family HTH domain
MSSRILEAARKSRGISQVQLALQAQTFQANISLIESGGTDPGISTIEQCLSPLGFTLIAIPTNKPTVAEFALTIGKAIREKKTSRAFRLIIQLNDNLKAVEPEISVALSAAPAPTTGSAQYDALLASVVEHSLSQRKLPIPKWVHEDSRRLDERWIVDSNEANEKAIAKVTPRAFLKHNVLIDQRELQSL